MKPSRAAFVIGIAAVALVAGMVLLLWPRGDAPRTPRPVERERTVDSAESAIPATIPESAPAGTISPRPLDAPAEARTTMPDAASAADGGPVVISGRVVDSDGRPAAIVPVLLHFARDGAPTTEGAARQTNSDSDGRFTFSVPRPFPEEWMVVAYRPERRPATVHQSGEPREPLELVLGEGAVIEGTVTLDGVPAPEARVIADMLGATSPSSFGLELWWTGRSFEHKRVQTVSGPDGRFRLTGLAEAEYQVNAMQLGRLRLFGVNPGSVVRAPATGVRLEAATARLKVKVKADGKILDRARVAMVASDGRQLRADAAEFADIRIAPGVSVTVDAAFAGFEPKTVTVPALAAGEVRDLEIALDPASSARLELRLQGAAAMGLKSVVVRFVATARPPENENRALQDLRQILIARSARQDDFVLESVPHPPGAYLLYVTSSGPSWLLPIQKQVVLPATGVLEVSADAVAGGRFEVAARDPGGTPLAGEYVLRDLQGAEILTRRFGPGSSGVSLSPRGVPTEELSRASGVLAAGTYEIEVKSEGFKAHRRQVTVKASSLIVEEVRLER